MSQYQELYEKEGWTTYRNKEGREVFDAYGDTWDAVHHPVAVHFKLYRNSQNPDSRYFHMKAAHDYLWPEEIKTWNYWTEDRFREHCRATKCITYAGGAHIGKSYDAAKIALLFWLADPKRRGVIIASTTLDSLQTRIWGYMLKLFNNTSIPIPGKYRSSPTPKILFKTTKEIKGKEKEDPLHGMFAVTAKPGDDEKTISTWIGKHPENGLMLVLDEATDMPSAILNAIPNLETARGFFQMMAIGNSNSPFDLHGLLSTPIGGWSTVDPMRDTRWQTEQGVCLFFSCYNSPAIHEKDPEKKKILSEIFINEERLEDKKKKLGVKSAKFWRMVLGFWQTSGNESVVLTQAFIETFEANKKAEWSGLYPLNVVAGLDAAYSAGGDKCLLRLGYLGADTEGSIVLDFREEKLKFEIAIVANHEDPVEVQIAKQTISILKEHNCRLDRLYVDGTGQGRAIGSLIAVIAQRESGILLYPKIIYSVRQGTQKNADRHVLIKSSYELWTTARDFIEKGQLKGLDAAAQHQFSTRLLINKIGQPPKVENKREYKQRMGGVSPIFATSPDEADGVALCIQSAIVNFGFFPGQKVDLKYQGANTPMFKQIEVMRNQGVVNNQGFYPGGNKTIHTIGGNYSNLPLQKNPIRSNFSSDLTALTKVKTF